MSKVIGIDLGTTHSVAAYMTDEGPRIPNALGEALTPSIVGLDQEGKLLVGQVARELQVLCPERCASLFKRNMGMDWTATLAGRKFTPEELSGLVLRSLKEDAEAHFGESITRAVITVPAYFNDQQRQATLNAGRIAGFKVERIFNEPTAAALAYGFHEAREDKVLLIFDLGGGTFDVSVVELFDGILEVKASSGETFLGGEDFTRTLAARVLDGQGLPFEKTELDAPRLISRMIQQAETAKCKLSSQESATLRIPDRLGNYADSSPQVAVTRTQFQKWTNHILGRVEMPIRRVLGDAGLKRENVHEVILVGGATRMPAVVELVTTLFGKKPHCRLNPDQVVGLGAAVQSGLIGREESVQDLVITDVAPFTLGMAISKRFGPEIRDGYFLPVIHRNTTIPVSRTEPVATLHPNQTDMVVQIYQGESRRVEQNLYLGEFAVQGIPSGPAGQMVEIRFTYDLNGILEVEATIVATRQKVSHVVTRHARGLSKAQLDRAIKDMAKLKTHPREESVNRLLLRRAERLFQELPQVLRENLSQLLDEFETALSQQDPEVIDRHRQALEIFLSQFDSSAPSEDDSHDDLPEQEAARSWATKHLGLSPEPSPQEIQTTFLEKVQRDGFLPAPTTSHAFQVLEEYPETAASDLGRQQARAEVEAKLNIEALGLAKRFFELSITERQRLWKSVWRRGSWVASVRVYLSRLKPALFLVPDQLVVNGGPTAGLAAMVCELFVLKPTDRARRRQELLDELRGEIGFWETTAKDLRKRFPQLAELEPTLFLFWRTGVNARGKFARRKQLVAARKKNASANSGGYNYAWIVGIAIFFLIRLLSSSTTNQRNQVPPPQFQPPQNQEIWENLLKKIRKNENRNGVPQENENPPQPNGLPPGDNDLKK